jgi:hypothetical protein
MNDTIQGAVATTAALSPWWLPAVHTISDVAAYLLPVMGVVWLGVQIATKLIEFRKERK